MACSQKKWLSNLQKCPCARCGYCDLSVGEATHRQFVKKQRPNTFTYAGPSADLHQADILTPHSHDSAMEEGLLISSDGSTGYGSTAHAEPTIEQPDKVIVGKGKKKKKKKACDNIVNRGAGHEVEP